MSSPISLVEAMYPQRGEEWVSTHANWPLCLMLRIGMRETEPAVAIENNSADYLQLIVPNLHRRYSGVTATNRMVAPKQLPDLARAAQQRDDRWRIVAIARLAAEAGVHLGGAARSQLDHALADQEDGRNHRHK